MGGNNAQTTITADSSSQWRTGWTFGAGVEYAIAHSCSAFVEYNYLDFGTKAANSTHLLSLPNYDRGRKPRRDRDKTTDPAYRVWTTLASLLLLKLGHSHGNRQLLCQCFGNVRRHDELHRDGFWSQLRHRDRSSKDHAPVQRMS
jgi:Outer membrane protein beta-barrel domain